MQSTRYHRANPNLKINTDVSGTAAAPEVVFKLTDDTEVSLYGDYVVMNGALTCQRLWKCPYSIILFSNVRLTSSLLVPPTPPSLRSQMRFDSESYTASEILFDVHLNLDKLDNEFEMSGKSLDE